MANKKLSGVFAQHVEKIVLGLCVLATLFLLYQGFSMPDYTEKQQPEELKTLAVQVKSSIDEPHWPAIKEERTVEAEFEERVEKALQPIPAAPYATNTPWEWKGKAEIGRRADPVLVVPGKPHMEGVLGAIAIQHSTERSYPLAELEDADPIEVEEKPIRRRSRPRRNNAMGAEGMMGEMGMGMMPEEMGMMDAGLAGGAGYPGMEGYPGMGLTGAPGTGNMSARRLASKYNLGFDVSKLSSVGTASRITPETAHFIAGTALIPHSDLVKAYDLAFENAKGRNPMRDVPVYWEFEVQRADVTDKPVDQLVEADWKMAFTFGEFEKRFKRWAGTAADIAPKKFTDGQLTLPLPPLMLRDIHRIAVHPDLPLVDELAMNAPGALGTVPAEPAEEEEESEEEAGTPNVIGPPSFGGGPPSFGAPGMMPGMEMGMGMGMEMGMGMGMGMGMEGYGYGSGSSMMGPPEYKLIRFYDFADPKNANSPKMGRKYVYRVHVAVEDPNFPRLPQMQPELRYLSAEAYARVSQKIRQAEANNGVRDPRLWTDWSEPSDPVSLPDLVRVYTGPVQPADMSEARRPRTVEYERNPPKAELVALKWDTKLATDLILPFEATPGSVLTKSGVATVIDPIDLSIRKTEERQIDTSTVVLDMYGGRELALADDPAITEPGMVLMFDENGGLKVLDELSQLDSYRLYSFADEREAAEAAAEAKANQEAMPEGDPAMMMMEEGGGGRRGRGGR